MSDDAWVLGLDSCPGGWAGIGWSGHDVVGVFGVDVAAVVGRFTEGTAPPAVIGIDIPIGLPDSGARSSDQLARQRLVGRGSTLFTTPTRAAMEQTQYQSALAVQRELTGWGLSKQAFNLRDKILDVDGWLPTAPCRVVEVHPELSFAAMQGSPVMAPKKSWAGQRQRLALLEAVGIVVPADVGELGIRAASDDVLDAAAVAWTARRALQGDAECVPDPPERFSDGLDAAIWT